MIENCHTGLEKRFNSHQNPTQEQQNLLEAVCSVYDLHVFYTMETELSEFLEDGYLSLEQAACVRQGFKNSLKAVRLNGVGFPDSFGFTDSFLNSVLGSWDGRAYERMAEMTEREPLNSEAMADKNGVIWVMRNS